MTKYVEDLNPELDPPRPQCCAKLKPECVKSWRGRSRPGNQAGSDHCQFVARYIIDGKPYCARHGGPVAISLLKKLDTT